MWDSHLAHNQDQRRKRRAQTQIQKGGVVYAADVPRDISTMEEAMARTESSLLDPDQKLHLLILRKSILPQLLLKTKERKEVANRTAINTIRRATRASKKRKHGEIEEETNESTPDQVE
jgi:hypothetical protein